MQKGVKFSKNTPIYITNKTKQTIKDEVLF